VSAQIKPVKACAGCSSLIVRGKFCHACQPKRTISMAELSPTEIEIVRLVSEGSKSKEIAQVVNMKQPALDNLIHKICVQLGITEVGPDGCSTKVGNRRVALTLAYLQYNAEKLQKEAARKLQAIDSMLTGGLEVENVNLDNTLSESVGGRG